MSNNNNFAFPNNINISNMNFLAQNLAFYKFLLLKNSPFQANNNPNNLNNLNINNNFSFQNVQNLLDESLKSLNPLNPLNSLREKEKENKEVLNKFLNSQNFSKNLVENDIEVPFTFQENDSMKSQNFFMQNNNQQNEYSDLSYLSNTNNANANNNSEIISKQKKNSMEIKKSCMELDFKIKYKTEKCKYWEINQTCKFGDSVRKIFS